MPKTVGLFLLALVASTALAADRPTVGRQPFPDDYKPHPCAPESACANVPDKTRLAATGAQVRSYSLNAEWVAKHGDEVIELMRPACAKLATCYATPGNDSFFCMDLMAPIFWSACDHYPAGSEMREQCALFARIYTAFVEREGKTLWKDLQACAAETVIPGPRTLKLRVLPEKIDETYPGKFIVYAEDAETHVPIQGLISMEGKDLSSRGRGGKPWTNFEIKWPAKFARVPNAEGHEDVVPATVTVTAQGYEPVKLALPMTPRKVIVEMTPSADRLKRGKNTVTIQARDAETGQPVELRVMLGETILGDSNEPLELEIKKGEKRPEIWARSLFNLYSDVVIAPAER